MLKTLTRETFCNTTRDLGFRRTLCRITCTRFHGAMPKKNEDFIGLHVSDTLDNLDVQDCVLAVPSSPWQLTFALGQQGKLSFF